MLCKVILGQLLLHVYKYSRLFILVTLKVGLRYTYLKSCCKSSSPGPHSLIIESRLAACACSS